MEEPLFGRVVLRQIRWEELDRHVPIQSWVTGLVDDAHAAMAELADDRIRTELRAGCEGHGEATIIRLGRTALRMNSAGGHDETDKVLLTAAAEQPRVRSRRSKNPQAISSQ